MYFSRVTFNSSVDHQLLAKTLCNDSYREHQALWRLFDTDPDAKRDFLYRHVLEHGRTKYYVLSKRKPIDTTGIWNIETPKAYKPRLSEGQKLFFMLRTNPVITVGMPNGKKQRHDVVMHEKKRIGFKEMTKSERPPLQKLIQESCIKWLDSRAPGHGFSLATGKALADGYQLHRSRAKKQEYSIRYSTVDFKGELTVVDPELFMNALFSGIGKSKAFGCGLMLVRRI